MAAEPPRPPPLPALSGRSPRGAIRPGFPPEPAPEEVERLAGYLADESRLRGNADLVAFPESEAEVAALVREAGRRGAGVTVSAGRTGVVGGAVPLGGWVLSVERLDRVHGFTWHQQAREFRLRVGAGLPLDRLQRAIRAGRFPFAEPPDLSTRALLEEFRPVSTRWAFPPDPTETTARLGGMVASNASGARTFAFGPTRAHVRGLTVVLADGIVLDLPRGTSMGWTGQGWTLRRPDGSTVTIPAPVYGLPPTKHAAGYFTAPGGTGPVDPVDLFIGSEGTLGVITEVEIALRPLDGQEAEVVALFPGVGEACRYVDLMRAHREEPGFAVEALEYMDAASLGLLQGAVLPGEVSNRLPGGTTVAVFTGLRLKKGVADPLDAVARLIDEAGGSAGDSLAGVGGVDIARLKRIRHALPETINALVARVRERHPGITKLATDMAVPDRHLSEVMALYDADLRAAGLPHYIFGHIGNNHLHVNIVPRDPDDYGRGRDLYAGFARRVVAMAGSVSAEHGIGKLKKYLMPAQFGPDALESMKRLRRALDPDLRLGCGTLFDL